MTGDPILDDPTPTASSPAARHVGQRTVDPATLVPYEGNPNIGDVEAVRESLRTNGQYRSPVTRLLPDGTLQVLAGHTTRLAAIAEGLPLRVDVVEADDAAARRIVAVDNQSARRSEVDEAALFALLDAASADGGLVGTGFTDAHFDDLRALLEEADRRPSTDSGSAPWAGGEQNVTQNNGLNDLKGAYFAGASRLVVLSYEGPRYVWVVEALAAVGARYGTDSNSDALVRLLEDATGTTAPTGEEAMTGAVDGAEASPSADA